MHGIYIQYGSSSLEQKSGIAKKITAQIKSFNDAGLHCEEYILPTNTGIMNSIKWRLPFFNISPRWEYDDAFNNADYIYMRRPMIMTKYMYATLEKVKKQNPKVKILIEIPTYPYDNELENIKLSYIARCIDRRNRVRMRNIVDRFVTLTDDREIFGLRTIKISNGIDLSKVKVKTYLQEEKDTIRICAVANFCFWHGYERFLVGLSNYYKRGGDRNIICEFVGAGPELENYKNIVNELNLNRNIIFRGFLEGDELSKIYNHSSVALGEFGGYKKNIFSSDSLKSREALARGIPMVIGSKTVSYDAEKYKYFYEFPNDDSILDITKIIEFHDKIYSEERGEIVVVNIREYAEKTIDIKRCMQPVIDYLQQ